MKKIINKGIIEKYLKCVIAVYIMLGAFIVGFLTPIVLVFFVLYLSS